MSNLLYFDDNINVLRRLERGSVDLIYLDPPFNSQQTYNVLYKSPRGSESGAQVAAFHDTWSWNEQTEREYHELLKQRNTDVAELVSALRRFMREGDLMAYLVMMASRLLEMQRVLKDSGTLYLHCDPTASHYLKLILDAAFGGKGFANEIIWKRTTTKNDHKQGAVNWPRVHDVLLVYHKHRKAPPVYKQQFTPHDPKYVEEFYKHEDDDGRRYALDNLAAPGRGMRGHPQYEFMGVTRFWRYNQGKMEQLLAEGRIVQTRPGAVPRYKRYLDEMDGTAIGDVWTDIPAVQGASNEFLGYPTQKPLALLERVIETASNPGDVVLDPFCGCGTAVHAAQKLGRRWIGIDITHLAISLIEKRLNDAFGRLDFRVEGRPRDLEGAADLAARDKYQFQDWACWLVGAQAYKGGKKGADRGVDGLIYFEDEPGSTRKVIVSVKGGQSVGVGMVRDLIGAVGNEGAELGFFVSLASPTREMHKAAAAAGLYDSPLNRSYPRIQLFTVDGLLDGSQRPLYPHETARELTFRKARREKAADKQETLFKPRG